LTKRLILVFDTSPLIVLLDELGMHEEIQRLAQLATIVIPKQVTAEYGKSIKIEGALTRATENQRIGKRGLGAGEQAVISIAKTLAQNSADTAVIAVSDDKRARKVCKEVGIECMGTLGLIELMKKNRIITKAKAITTIRAVEKTSLYVTKHLIDEVITKIQNQEP